MGWKNQFLCMRLNRKNKVGQQEYIKQELVFRISCSLFLIIIFLYFYIRPIEITEARHEYMNYVHYGMGEITSDTVIQQEFYAVNNYLSEIELFFANVYSDTEGKILLRITDKQNDVVWERALPANSIEVGKFLSFRVGERMLKGDLYYLEVSYTELVESIEDAPRIMFSLPEYNLIETGECYRGMDLNDQNVAITYVWSEVVPEWWLVLVLLGMLVLVRLGISMKNVTRGE